MVDVALQSAFTDLCTQAPTGDTSPLFATVATFLYFDAKTNQIILHPEQNFYDEVFFCVVKRKFRQDLFLR